MSDVSRVVYVGMKSGNANWGVANDFGTAPRNITQVGSLTSVPYAYTVTPLANVVTVVLRDVGLGKI